MEPASGRALDTAPYDFTTTREQAATREEPLVRVPTIVEPRPAQGEHDDASMPAQRSAPITVEPWVEPAAAMSPPRLDHPQEHRSVPRPPWLLVVAALVCVGLIAWWAASQRGQSFDPQQLIETQLQAAEKAAGEGHFVDPYEGSALHHYSTVLTIDATNPRALAGVQRLAERLIASARVHLDAGRYADAVMALNGARRIDPSHRGLAPLEGDLRRELQTLAARAPSSPAAKEAATLAATMAAAAAETPKPAASKKTEPEALAATPSRLPEAAGGASASMPKVADVTKQSPPVTASSGAAAAPAKETATAASAPAKEVAALATGAALATEIPSGTNATIAGTATSAADSGAPGASVAPVSEPTATSKESLSKAAGDVLPPIVKYVPPEYPDDARVRGIEGWADLTFLVGANGEVVDPRVEDSSRRQLFGRPALSALRKWRYEAPAPGHPSLTERTRVRIEFRLER